MVINTPYGNSGPRIDGYEIRSAAVAMNIPCVTTVQGASAAVQGIEAGIRGDIGVMSLQELHSALGQLTTVTGFGRPAGRRGVRARARCARASIPIPSCWRPGACRPTSTGCAGSVTSASRRSTDFAIVKPQVAFFEAYGAAGLRGAGTHHRARCATPACWCWPTPSAVTSARRWPPTPPRGPATRRWPSTPSPHRRTWASARCGRCSTPPRPTVAACSSSPPRPTPRAPGCSAPTPTDEPWRSRSSTPRRPSTAPRRRSRVRWASSSAPRSPTPPDVSALNGPVLVPGVGAQGGRPDALRGFGGARPGQLLPAVSREVLRAGPDVAAVRAAAERMRDAVAYLA